MKFGLHQGSALSPLLFITVMDVISDEIGRGPHHAVLFADDLVICETKREQADITIRKYDSHVTRTVPVSRAWSSLVPGVVAYFRPSYAAGQE